MTVELATSRLLPRRFGRPTPRLEVHEGDLARADMILSRANRCEPQSNAALLGDKRLLFSSSGRSFISYAPEGANWLAFGGPVGLADEALDLARHFIDLAQHSQKQPSFYGVGPSFDSIAQHLGLRKLKTGERAILDLTQFSLEGKQRQVIRTHRNRHLKNNFRVCVEGPGAVRANLGRLQVISDQWLSHQAGGEKGFGLGRFDIHYIDRLPLATVRTETGNLAAFATLWPTADQSRLGVDLMRYGDDAPNGVMDFLFAELFLWAKAQGYREFDLNTAPLAGVEPCMQSPFLTSVGKLMFEHGEKLYNFKGVRRFKNKFHPHWEDVYLASPKGVSQLSALAKVTWLINRPR
ncbi:phosphatidylglycerol lysyltransferase domain-containing protein [Candidatus Phycosocius spiralis]|nr:phosphatidylglycerol lysyltransferase domain-containing protein [Candidatus Phycosocius spiralis]